MSHWLCISSDYNQIIISLCSSDKIVESHAIDKKFGNQRLLSDIDIILKRHNLDLNDMTFIGVNLGPAPYTGLRIAIATANGLHAATGIPLVGIDALKAFLQGNEPNAPNQATVVLLNAFNNDLFYAIAEYGKPIETGYEKSETLLSRLALQLNGLKITQLGNGFKPSSCEPIEYPSQGQLVNFAWSHRKHTTHLALPLYLKQITR